MSYVITYILYLALEAVPTGAMEDDVTLVPAEGLHVAFVARFHHAFALSASVETADDLASL